MCAATEQRVGAERISALSIDPLILKCSKIKDCFFKAKSSGSGILRVPLLEYK